MFFLYFPLLLLYIVYIISPLFFLITVPTMCPLSLSLSSSCSPSLSLSPSPSLSYFPSASLRLILPISLRLYPSRSLSLSHSILFPLAQSISQVFIYLHPALSHYCSPPHLYYSYLYSFLFDHSLDISFSMSLLFYPIQ